MTHKYICLLSSVSSPELYGAKSYNLARLAKHGLPVPQTYCINSDAYGTFVYNQEYVQNIVTNTNISISNKAIEIQKFIDHIDDITELYEELKSLGIGHDPFQQWAVRSSATCEDLSSASFAGIYDSFLNIAGYDAIVHSLKECWKSLWSERAVSYYKKAHVDIASNKMAVIVQEMVCAERSGVLFTRNPLSLDKNELVFEYCDGSGEQIVSGHCTPNSCVIDRNTFDVQYRQSITPTLLDSHMIIDLVHAADTIEKLFAAPQDIELAIIRNELMYLQTRPITEGSQENVKDDTVWTRANIGEVLPSPVTPITWDIFCYTLFQIPFKESIDEIYIEEHGLRRINGCLYIKAMNFYDSFCSIPFVTMHTMKKVLGVDIPNERVSGRRISWGKTFFFLCGLLMSGTYEKRYKRVLGEIPHAVIKNIDQCVAWTTVCFQLHLKITRYAIGAFALLDAFVRKTVSGDLSEILGMIIQKNSALQTAAQGKDLWHIAQCINQNADLKKIFHQEHSWETLKGLLCECRDGVQVRAMIYDFLEKNGARAVEEFELARPRWNEDIDYVLLVLKKYLSMLNSDIVPTKQKDVDDIIVDIEKRMSYVKRALFRVFVKAYRNFSQARENMKYTLMTGYASIRIVLLEYGRDFCKRSIIDVEDDIFYLYMAEIRKIAENNCSNEDMRNVVLQRKKEREKQLSLSCPYATNGNGNYDSNENSPFLSGIPCSPGVVEGKVRILMSISDSEKLHSDEILVTPHTDPGWTPLFLACKGVVTEIGGFLSHSATVAREYGVPAVFGVPHATKILKTGDTIKIDGSSGIITKV